MAFVECNPKTSFSIATRPRCRGGCFSISRIAPLYPWSLPYSFEWSARRHQVTFLSLWYNSIWDWTPNDILNLITKLSSPNWVVQLYIIKTSKINKNSLQKITKQTIVTLRTIRDMVESARVNMGYFLHYSNPNIQKEIRRLEHLNRKIIRKKITKAA